MRQNASLLTAARRHSGEMASDGYFGHDSFDGSPFWKRLDGARPRGHRWLSAGENLYWGTSDVTADAVTWAWMTSPEHRTILLSPAWRGMGISAIRAPAAPGTFGGEDVVIVTADFGG